jgi:hypothetical protein
MGGASSAGMIAVGGGSDPCAGKGRVGGIERKQFFFEKKNQKTFFDFRGVAAASPGEWGRQRQRMQPRYPPAEAPACVLALN